MGNRLPNLDMMLDKAMRTYWDSLRFKDYWTAGQALFQSYQLLPSEAKMVGSQMFKLKPLAVTEHPTYGDIANTGRTAQAYCEVNAPLVMSAISKFTETIVAKIIDEQNNPF